MRALAALAVGLCGLAFPLASTARESSSASGRIVLKARRGVGPWVTSLSLKLEKQKVKSFTVCGVWGAQVSDPFTCRPVAGDPLPSGTTMRVEQSPIANAMRRPDSPGWGLVGTSMTGSVTVVLSNNLTGNRLGTFRYRVTLRDASGHVLASSNKVTLVWHR